jgi:hypothetical protein
MDFVGPDVLTDVTTNNAAFWVVTPCSFDKTRCFGGTYSLRVQVPKYIAQETSRSSTDLLDRLNKYQISEADSVQRIGKHSELRLY